MNANRVATGIALVASALLLVLATDGLRAFTTEGARRLDIVSRPRVVPVVQLEQASGGTLASDALQGRAVLVDFIYTQCASVCPLLSERFGELQTMLRERGLEGRVALLSVSFDPTRDTASRLAEYGIHVSADPALWRLARVPAPAELEAWLRSFGITVIPDGRGGFEHNAAIHVVDARGRLIAVFDLERGRDALDAAVAEPRG